MTDDATPLVVEVVTADARPVTAPARARPARSASVRSGRASLPPTVPIVTEDESPLAEPPALAEIPLSGVNAASEPSAPMASEAIVAVVLENETPDNRLAGESSADEAQPRVAALGGDSAAPGAEAAYGRGAASVPARVNLARLDEVTRNPRFPPARRTPFVRPGRLQFSSTTRTSPLTSAGLSGWRAIGCGVRTRLFVDDGWGATGRVFVVYAPAAPACSMRAASSRTSFSPSSRGRRW
jgi:hypothetical protein